MSEKLTMLDVEDWLNDTIAKTGVVADAMEVNGHNHGHCLILESILDDMRGMKISIQEAKREKRA